LTDWQRRLLDGLGARFSSASADAPAELVWTNLPSSWGVFVFLGIVAAAVYAIFALYRRELASCPRWAKATLGGLRAACLMLLVVILLNPAVVHVEQRTLRPTIVVLRDASQSMNTVDALLAGTISRVETVNRVLASEDAKLVEQLASKGRIAIADFAEQVKWREGPEPLVAEGRETDLAAAIRQALAVGRPAAIVMLTDGQHTANYDPRAAAREAAARRVPLMIVGIGDPTRRQNVAVRSVSSVPQTWRGEPFEIEATIQFQGTEASEVLVELIEQRADDASNSGGAVVQSRQVPVPASESSQARVQFTHAAKADGAYIYRVRAHPPAGDALADDDMAVSNVVNVESREQVRVLLVAGSPTWDYRLLQKLLVRDKTMSLSCWLQSLDEDRAPDGTAPIRSLPRTKAELFAYDVLLLLDPDPRELDEAWVELVTEFVGQHGGGLFYMAGPKYTGQLLTTERTAGIARLLPVTFGDLKAQQVTALLATNQRAWPLSVPAASGDHPLLRFFPDREETVSLWNSLPGVLWSFPCQEAKPTAQVLVEHSDPTLRGRSGGRPLLVSGRFGAGQTVYLGMEGTWRWRKAGRQAEFFDKFWVQAVRSLVAGRSLAGRQRGMVQTDRDRYEIGERIVVTARLLDDSYEPLVAEMIDATVAASGQADEHLTLLPEPNRPGEYVGATTARRLGSHEISVNAAANGTGARGAHFHVELPSAETSQVWLNKPLLLELASLSGGRYFDVDQAGDVVRAVPDQTETIETRTPPEPIWDTGGMLLALVGLLCTEWLLRKRFQLL
jgi:hypothetical protein